MWGKTIFILYLVSNLFMTSAMQDRVNEFDSVTQSMSVYIYHQFLTAHKTLTALENPDVETLNRVAWRVINAVKKYPGSKKSAQEIESFAWELNLVAEKKADAWCFPGGKIAVYSSLLPITQSDASLAVVLSHEIAHTLLKHGDNRMKQYLKQFLGGKNLSTALSSKPIETKDFFKMAYANGDYVGVIRGFDPSDETAADQLGAIFCAMAGYNPLEYTVFWERMRRFSGTGHEPELISSHPVDEKRVSWLKENMDEIARVYYKPIIKK